MEAVPIARILAIFFTVIHYAHGDKEAGLDHVLLDVNDATLKGATFVTSGSGIRFHAFQSLPYAEPPVNGLRFQPPVPKGLPQTGLFDATHDLPFCPQWTIRNPECRSRDPMAGQEDCLYLNVYVPEKIYDGRANADSRVPVMVWIHGGGFIAGGGSYSKAIYAPDNFMDTESVILVSINYRLGALGFLSLEDDKTVAGNMGMKDQIVALKWVRDNIETFGGDPLRVTIFGESAGGISVMDLVSSPLAAGLFSAGISQSGPGMLMPFMREYKPPGQYGQAFLEFVGCRGSNGTDIMGCLNKAPLPKILEGSRMFERYTYMPSIFKPVVDAEYAREPFLPDNRNANPMQGSINQVPLMMGGTLDEGGILMLQFMMNETNFQVVSDAPDFELPSLFFGAEGDQALPESTIKAGQEVLQRYTTNHDDPNWKLAGKFAKENWQGLRDAFTDLAFLAPIDITAREAAKASEKPVFYYNYRHKGELTLLDIFGYDKVDMGVSHADELLIQFNPVSKAKSEKDAAMTRKMVELWTGFATAEDHHEWGRRVRWAPVDRDEEEVGQFHILDLGELRMPDVEGDETEKRRRDQLSFAANVIERELQPRPIKRKAKDVASSGTSLHGGEL